MSQFISTIYCTQCYSKEIMCQVHSSHTIMYYNVPNGVLETMCYAQWAIDECTLYSGAMMTKYNNDTLL